MFERVRSIRYWLKTKKMYREGNYADAIIAYNAFANLFSERARDRAFFATLCLLNENFDAALEEFLAVSTKKYPDKNLDEQEMLYVIEYAKMHVCGLRNDGQKRVHYDRVKSLPVRQFLRRLLPVSDTYIGP